MDEPTLMQSIAQLSSSDILVDCRPISASDVAALLGEEERSISSQRLSVRRASGAARILGRQLLSRLGYSECAIPKGETGAPVWPKGIIGSFAHNDDFAVAALARRRDVSAVGIDVEPAELLPAELYELVMTIKERRKLAENPYLGRLIFAAKEAVYKAVAVLDGTLLDYHDIETDLVTRQAVLGDGRIIRLRYCLSTQLVVLAFIPRSDTVSQKIGNNFIRRFADAVW